MGDPVQAGRVDDQVEPLRPVAQGRLRTPAARRDGLPRRPRNAQDPRDPVDVVGNGYDGRSDSVDLVVMGTIDN